MKLDTDLWRACASEGPYNPIQLDHTPPERRIVAIIINKGANTHRPSTILIEGKGRDGKGREGKESG